MPTWLKLLLGFFAAGALGLALLVGGGAWWVSKNKDRLTEGGHAAKTEGAAFGRTHSKNECIDDGLKHLKDCGPVDFVCEALTRLRLTSCMSVAKDDGACAGVPAQAELMKGAFWENAECTRRGYAGSQPCSRLMQGVVLDCGQSKP
jgi:hypothetical protein